MVSDLWEITAKIIVGVKKCVRKKIRQTGISSDYVTISN
jgi:hypothetical protein